MNLSMNINFGARNPLQGAPGGFPNVGGGAQMQLQMMQMMMMMMQLMGQLMGGHQVPMGSNFGGSPMGGGFPGGSAGLTPFLGSGAPASGGFPSMGGGGAAPYGGAGATGGAAPAAGGTGAPGSGQAAVDLARKYLGRDSIGLKGDMPHFTAAGGVTNNCVDFVSSALESQGLVKGHHINVKAFEKELQKQGYRQIPFNQAQPGDVWINHSRGHTELVATPGAKTTIGSNGSARQKISEVPKSPNSGIIYAKR